MVIVTKRRTIQAIEIMKTYKNLWEQFISKENFELACTKSMKGKKGQRQVREFLKDRDNNLEAVRQLVISGKFTTSKYKQRKIYEPKERIIYKLPYCPDRIVQHAVMNILEPLLTQRMIENTYSCIKKRGQLKASLKCSEYVRKYDYCLKCDISKFYPSIDQQILSDMFHKIIKDDKFMAIIDDVIFSFQGGKNCPIGNYLSQWFGNFYLTKLDNYILHELKVGGYERYCDDFILFDNDKEHLKDCRKKIKDFIETKLLLKYSKSEIFPTSHGVDFCGYRHFGKYVLVRKSTGLRIRRRFRKIEKKLNDGMGYTQKLDGQVASAHGVLCHACTHHLYEAMHFRDIEKTVERMRNDENINTQKRQNVSDHRPEQSVSP